MDIVRIGASGISLIKKYSFQCTGETLVSFTALEQQGVWPSISLGWNEAYDDSNKKAKKKYIAPADAATYWRTFESS